MAKRPISIDDLADKLPASMKEDRETPKAELYRPVADVEMNTEKIIFRCSKEFKERLKNKAAEEHLDVSSYIRRVIYQDIENHR